MRAQIETSLQPDPVLTDHRDDASEMRSVNPTDAACDTFWRTVIEQAPIALSLLAPDGRQIMGNAAYATLLGYEVDEVGALDVARISQS